MSWDVSFFAAKTPPPRFEEVAADWKPEPMGARSEIRAKIDECIPGVDWREPSWGRYVTDQFCCEFNIGHDGEPCDSFMVHIHGQGDVVATLRSLETRWGWYLLDLTQMEWLHCCESDDAGWKHFQDFCRGEKGNTNSDDAPG